MGREQAVLNILFTNDSEIHKLNRDYRGKDKPTDVLSFPADKNFPGEHDKDFIGELVISIPTAARQAKDYGVSLREELLRLLVHGLLHLFGYDHEGVSKAEAQKMRRLEERLLNEQT